jgi:hypothetical protein
MITVTGADIHLIIKKQALTHQKIREKSPIAQSVEQEDLSILLG